jgi:hypothetical protein
VDKPWSPREQRGPARKRAGRRTRDRFTKIAEPEVAGHGSVDMAVVPDVVGMNHQLAQDTLQASGFYLLHEEDATGQAAC